MYSAATSAFAAIRMRHGNTPSGFSSATWRRCQQSNDDATQRQRVTALLLDVVTGRYVWADHYDGDDGDLPRFHDRMTTRIARAVDRSVRAVEIDRCCRKDASQLNAWELTLLGSDRLRGLS